MPQSVDLNAVKKDRYDSYYECECHAFWKLVVEHANRWKKVEISDDNEHDDVTPLYNLYLPSLKELAIYTHDDWDNPKADSRVCLTWTMPALKDMWSTQRIFDMPTSLQSFRLEILYLYLVGDVSPRKMLQFLTSPANSQLKDFTMEFVTPKPPESDEDMMDGEQPNVNVQQEGILQPAGGGHADVGWSIAMPSVRKLLLCFRDDRRQRKRAFKRIIKHLAFPEVEHIEFTCTISKDRDAGVGSEEWNPLEEELVEFTDWLLTLELRKLRWVQIRLRVPRGKVRLVKRFQEEEEDDDTADAMNEDTEETEDGAEESVKYVYERRGWKSEEEVGMWITHWLQPRVSGEFGMVTVQYEKCNR
jgi:hypothetical protein